MKWLIDESKPIDTATERDLSRAIGKSIAAQSRGSASLAVRVHNMVIHDTKKWFGDASIRLDTLVVYGPNPNADKESFYIPGTQRFNRVRDGDRLPIGDSGLLIFYGKPRYFLDISITVSRDRKDTKDLSTLVKERLKSSEFSVAASTILGLTAVAPQAAAVVAAVQAAATLGGLSAEVLHQATDNTIGLYRASYLQHSDAFGLGRHPDQGEFRSNDFSFHYEIEVDRKERTTTPK